MPNYSSSVLRRGALSFWPTFVGSLKMEKGIIYTLIDAFRFCCSDAHNCLKKTPEPADFGGIIGLALKLSQTAQRNSVS
jgi:hypothetical protein